MPDFFTMEAGETAAPVPAGPDLCTATAEMRRIHRVFLWAYDEAPGLVRSAEPGETSRAAYVGDVLGNFDKLLHVHHESEDTLMYPRLESRAPACALHVAQMLEHHRQVSLRLEVIEPLRERWMEFAHREDRDRLAELYEDLSAVLKVHLRREVTEVMPVVDKLFTAKEMEEVAQHSTGEFSMKIMLAYLGMVLATNPPGEREELLKSLPAPVRLGYRMVGRRLYRKQYATLFPGREIPATL